MALVGLAAASLFAAFAAPAHAEHVDSATGGLLAVAPDGTPWLTRTAVG